MFEYHQIMQSPQERLVYEFSKRRERNENFSLRSFAKWLGVSPGQLSQMMAGKRTVTFKTMKKIGDRLGLSPSEKKSMFAAILKGRNLLDSPQERKVLKLQDDQFRVIADWYHLAILSLTRLEGAKADPRWISRRLGISQEQASLGLQRLERLGIIQTKPKFQQTSDPIEAVSDVPSEAIRKYHKQNLNLAIEKIDLVAVHLRQFQSISFPTNPKKIGALKKLIDDFLEQAIESVEQEKGTEVYNLNVQLFPVTKIEGEP